MHPLYNNNICNYIYINILKEILLILKLNKLNYLNFKKYFFVFYNILQDEI